MSLKTMQVFYLKWKVLKIEGWILDFGTYINRMIKHLRLKFDKNCVKRAKNLCRNVIPEISLALTIYFRESLKGNIIISKFVRE